MSEIKKIKVNQVEYTLGNEQYAKDIEALQKKVFVLECNPSVSLTATPNVVYKNEATNIKLTAVVNGITDTSLINELKITSGSSNTPLQTGSTVSSLTYTDNATLTANTSFAASAIINGVTFKNSATISAKYPMYIGFGKEATDVAISKNKLSPRTSCKGVFNIENTTGKDLHVFILIPTDITDYKSVTFGGAPIAGMENVSTVTINNISYNVRKSQSLITVRTMEITIV